MITTEITGPAWDSLSYAEKNKLLYERQKKMLEEFLERARLATPSTRRAYMT